MFKVGDKVRCINNKHRENEIQIGKVYTVVSIITNTYEQQIILKDVNFNIGIYSHRFILVDEVKIEKEEDYYKWLAGSRT